MVCRRGAPSHLFSFWFWLAVVGMGIPLTGLLGCSGSSDPSDGPPPSGPTCEAGAEFHSTFEAIQEVIFERRGCTQQICHGSAALGGLDLSPAVAHHNIFEVPSTQSSLRRVEPGDDDRSYLFQKLLAGTRPGSVTIAGAPMPNGMAPLSEDELEAMRLWIYAGAPHEGVVDGTSRLLDACLPDPEPLTIEPLEPPAPGDGVQFVLPPLPLPARSEQEVCFASYYDFTDQVPAEFTDPSGRFFRYAGQELRQDPTSHHLVLLYSGVPDELVHHPAFGAWTCSGGGREGEVCEPTDPTSCGSGICHSEVAPTIGCAGYGPPGYSLSVFGRQIGGAQAPQAYQKLREGVFAQIPLKGILYWSSHAFNVTEKAHVLNGRLNFTFARSAIQPLLPIFDVHAIFQPNAAPYTIETYCAEHVLPQGTRLFGLTSHTHKQGKHFTVHGPDGALLFENFVYNDPVKQGFDPPLEFDSPDPAQRTLEYCATYNNGVAADGSPDPETVTRWSRVPESARTTIGRCVPVACVAGRIGAACNGEGDDRTCDSAPGAGDGFCDACPITGGESTENEMFILIGQTYIDERYPQPSRDGPIFGGLASVGP